MLEKLKDNKKIINIITYIFSILSILCCFLFNISFLYLILGIILGILGIVTSIITRLHKENKTTIDSLLLASVALFFNILLSLTFFISFVNETFKPETKQNEPTSFITR